MRGRNLYFRHLPDRRSLSNVFAIQLLGRRNDVNLSDLVGGLRKEVLLPVCQNRRGLQSQFSFSRANRVPKPLFLLTCKRLSFRIVIE